MINASFGDCKTARLHLADSIQPFGVMLIIDREGEIVAVSANSEEWLDAAPETLLGRQWGSVLPAAIAPIVASAGSVDQLQLQPFVHNNRERVAAIHTSGAYTIVEIETSPEVSLPAGGEAQLLARGIADLATTETVEAAAKSLLHAIAGITGYDRAMLYQFLPDWHGKVVAEVLQPGVEGFLGLHFPAGDIPAIARQLYLKKRQRIIADVQSEPVAILGYREGVAIDLTCSELRAVHPTHIEYLKNMGVGASFSVSVVVGGELWGLIACHHFSARCVGFAVRQLCEQLASVAALHMSDLQRLAQEQARHRHHEALANARLSLQAEDAGKRGIAGQLSRFRHAFSAVGGWAHLDGQDFFSGKLPDDAGLVQLRQFSQGLARDRIMNTSSVAAELEPLSAVRRLASGLLFMPLGESDFLLLSRPEQRENVEWAGRPDDTAGQGSGSSAPLGPRASFESWVEQIRGQALPWLESDLEAAEALRQMLLEHIERVRLEQMAMTDPLTGLSNRARFERKLKEAIGVSLRDDVLAAVLMIDLDHFKPVNDRYGHAAGDALLVEVARRLCAGIRDRDIAARLGGDEFAVILFRAGSSADVAAVAARLLAALREPFPIETRQVTISASIGAALCPQHAVDGEELLEKADQALYRVKEGGRDGFCLFGQQPLNGGPPSAGRG